MNKHVKRLVGEVPAQEKSIDPLLLEIIRIISEGGVELRVANFLMANGFTDVDVWRELKKGGVPSDIGQTVLNIVRDEMSRNR